MSGVQTPESFVVRVPATSANLGPGFDCLGIALTLHNTIEVLPGSAAGEALVEITGEGAGILPSGPENVVVRAMCALADSAGAALPSCRIRLHNRIPLGRGLGSSAAAIVGGIFAAAILLGISTDPEVLLPVALRLESHPDNVAAALFGGLTLGVLAGGRTIVRRFDAPPDLRAVLLIPDQFSSTHESRAVLPAAVERADAIFNAGRCALLFSDLSRGRLDALTIAMQDRLHQPQRASTFRYLNDAIDAAIAAGAHGAALSGAGSSVIALATDHPDRVAAALAEVAQRYRIPATTCILHPESRGATRAS